MNTTNNDLSRLHEIVEKSQAGAIVLTVNPSMDALAAATSIYLGLVKAGKNVSLVCEMSPKCDLVATDKIQQEFTTSGDNLVISFPYVEGSIDKVDYNIQGEIFNLIVTPRAGQPKLEPQKVKYSYSGGSVDFIITIDAPNLHSLGRISSENKSQFQGKTIINIDRHLVNDFFGTVNMVNKTSSSTSELAFQFLREIDVEIDKDMATNLYAGLLSATNNFTSYSVNADTFETAAALLKLGAIKKPLKNQSQPIPPPSKKQFVGQQQPPKKTYVGVSHSGEQQLKPIEEVEREESKDTSDQQTQNWLKPKIFRGTGLI